MNLVKNLEREGSRATINNWREDPNFRSYLAECYRKGEEFSWGNHNFNDESNIGLIKSRTVLVEMIELCEIERKKFVDFVETQKSSKEDHSISLYLGLRDISPQVLAEFADAKNCITKKLTEIERKLRQLENKEIRQRRGTVFAEEIKTETLETYSPPDWTNK